MQPTKDRVLAVACMPGLSHPAFRLYVILDGAARQQAAPGGYFPVTLKGLLEIHPGVAGRRAGPATVIKHMAELRQLGLVQTRSTLHRTRPELPVLVKVVNPEDPGAAQSVGALVGLQ